jgi:LmbE family N-acetylglucosaminyl deacetylase
MMLAGVLFAASARGDGELRVEGAPTESGFPVGSQAEFRVKLTSESRIDFKQVLVFADVSYMGTTAVSSAQLDLKSSESEGGGSRAIFEGRWLIPSEAPSGIYSVTLRVEDRGGRKIFTRQRIRGFAAYKKPIRIARVTLDRTFYTVGQPIRCEVLLQNLSSQDARGLRVEFSNANYPWISLFDKKGDERVNPELAIKVLREGINLPPLNEVTIPMSVAGQAAFLKGEQSAVLGSGLPARSEAAPEVNTYTVAVWNADRTVLYDMQFTSPVIVRAPGSERPWPYGAQYLHAYNSDIDFKKYREFYPAGYRSPVIQLDRSRTTYRPGDPVAIKAMVKNIAAEDWKGPTLTVSLTDVSGKEYYSGQAASWAAIKSGGSVDVVSNVWKLPADIAAGTYRLRLTLTADDGRILATTNKELAVNHLPAALMLFNAHPDDEVAYAGMIRAAVEAGIPVRVVTFTSGDVGACERYYSKACGPNEAREFGLLRMEESADAFAHLGVARDNLIFLGLPDGGSGAIWFQHRSAERPFRSIYLATDHAPYENVFKPNLAYSRDAVIEATKQLIAEFRPAMILTPHPDERHVDHRVASWIVVKACQELLREQRLDPKTQIVADVSYGAGGYQPAPFHYEALLIHLSGEAAALKQEMEWFYQSQHGNYAEGSRKSYGELPRFEEHLRIVDWQKAEGWNE